MREDNQDVSSWFAHGTLTRITERRTHGITADHVLGDLVRRPGDPSRNAATSLTTRAGEPIQEPPGAGEWHGARFGITVLDDRGERVGNGAERVGEFRQALEEAGVDPAWLDAIAFRAAVDASVGFSDRKFEGRRHRPTSGDQRLEGRSPESYPQPGPVNESRYRSW